MLLKRRVIFCANHISLIIAVNLADKDKRTTKTIIFYDPIRCDVTRFNNFNLIPYSRCTFITYLFKSCFVPPFEICVPHFRGGRLIRTYSKYAKKLSVIDDGLDTFREFPRNIVVSDFKSDSNYYTFNYDAKLATWLSGFNLINVCELEEIARSSKQKIDLSDFDVVLVESPGIGSVILPDLSASRVLLVKHSNPNKNVKAFESCPSIIGSDFALEDSIKTYQGTLIVGESMTAVYALQLKSPNFKLLIAINEDNKKNLTSFLDLVGKTSFAKLLVAKT